MSPPHICNIKTYLCWTVCTFLLLSHFIVHAAEKNGFELDGALIPPGEIFHGGPSKDGIPSIDKPVFVKPADADYLEDDDAVLGIVISGQARAYPLKILNWHEIVNDEIDNQPFVITYCPLCGSGVAFDRRLNGETLSFGVSGLLYNSDVLLYDRESESLWSQLMNKAVTGEHKGASLTMLPIQHTTWSDWKRVQPETKVLSDKTGYWRNYNKSPYRSYNKSTHLYFPISIKASKQYHPKENVLGIDINGLFKAYPFIELNKHGKQRFNDRVGDTVVTIHWNRQSQSGSITLEDGIQIPVIQSYWFAWYAFHPDTLLFTSKP